jgi:hypothetical protein
MRADAFCGNETKGRRVVVDRIEVEIDELYLTVYDKCEHF